MDGLGFANYGLYIWACFGLTLVVVVGCDVLARLRHKRIYRDIEVRIKALEERQ